MKLFEKNKMNKKASMVLRDVIMLVIVFTGIIALSSVFVNDVADTYGNTNMSTSYNQDNLGKTQLENTSSTWHDIGERFGEGNFIDILVGTYESAMEIITSVLKAPATFSSMLMSILEDIGVDETITDVLGFIITAGLYITIIFVIISSFLKGGKM